MNKTAKVILSSVLTMTLCTSLIAGSTFALFTNESKTNVAITAGKVDLQATAKITEAYSLDWNDGENDYKKVPATADGNVYTFTNKGTASYADGKLALSNITPGDCVNFTITTTNESSIAIKYRTVVTFVGGGATKEDGEVNAEGNNAALFHALNITVKDDSGSAVKNMENISSDRSTAVSEWSQTVEPKGAIGDIKVSIEFPTEGETSLQGQSCMIAIGVYAVQSNGHDESKEDVYLVAADSNLNDVFEEAQNGDTIVLAEDMTMPEEGLTFEGKGEEKNLTFDMNGNDFTASADTNVQSGFVIGEGAELTIKNEAATPDGELPKFSVAVDKFSDNWKEHQEGKYTLRVDGGTLNVEGVNFDITNAEGDTAMYVNGGTVNFDETTKLTMEGKDNHDAYRDGFGTGMFVSQGSTVTLEGTELHTTGAISPFIVGFSSEDEDSTLTLKNANITFENMYNNIEKGTVVAGLQAYPNGKINVENSTLTVCGDTVNYTTETENINTNSVALSCVGGGDIDFKDSKMILNVNNGRAIAAQTITNYYDEFENDAARENAKKQGGAGTGVVLDAHIHFMGESVIEGHYETERGGVTMFCAQRNGKHQWFNPDTGDYTATSTKVVLKGGDDVYSIIIDNTVKVMKNDVEIYADEDEAEANRNYRGTYHDYDGQSWPLDTWLSAYTVQAIKDNRVKP